MIENNFIFENLFQALRISYLMEILQCSTPNSVTILQQLNYCYTYTRGNNNIHFDGLNDLEIHGQCALIRNAVEKQLPYLLSCVIVAKYATNNLRIEKIYKKKKKIVRIWYFLIYKKLKN